MITLSTSIVICMAILSGICLVIWILGIIAIIKSANKTTKDKPKKLKVKKDIKDRTKVLIFIAATIIALVIVEIALAIYSAAIHSDLIYGLDAAFLESISSILSALGVGSWLITIVKTVTGKKDSCEAEWEEIEFEEPKG